MLLALWIHSSALRAMCDSQIESIGKGYVSCHIPMAHIDIEAYTISTYVVLLPYFLFPITIFSLTFLKAPSMRLDQFVSTTSQTVNAAAIRFKHLILLVHLGGLFDYAIFI